MKFGYNSVLKSTPRETAKTGFYFAAKGVRKASVLSERIKLTYVPLRFSPRREPSLSVK